MLEVIVLCLIVLLIQYVLVKIRKQKHSFGNSLLHKKIGFVLLNLQRRLQPQQELEIMPWHLMQRQLVSLILLQGYIDLEHLYMDQLQELHGLP